MLPKNIRAVLAALAVGIMAATTAFADDAAIAGRHGFPVDDIGYVLFDPATGGVLAERQAGRAFLPASVAKLATMAAGLALLGPDHRFTTRLYAKGQITAGQLRGDLILVGDGDPFLATGDLTALADALVAQGVRTVSGHFFYDAGHLPELTAIDDGQPLTADYNTGVSALSVNFNRFQLAWRRRGAGGPVEADAWTISDRGRHPLDSVRIEIGTDGQVPVAPLPGGDRWRVTPQPGMPDRLWLPVSRPAAATAALFRRVAHERNITLPTPVHGTAPAGAREIATHDSLPLDRIAAAILRYSNNLSAELVGLAAVRRLDPGADTLGRSAAALTAWLKGQSPATDWSAFHLANHSGLTTASRVTPRQMAAILMLGGDRLWALLPGGDEDGPLPGVHAKSGTLAYAKGLAGMLRTTGGQTRGFVFFVGDDVRRADLDATMDRLTAELPADARAWLVRARALQNDFVDQWRSAPP